MLEMSLLVIVLLLIGMSGMVYLSVKAINELDEALKVQIMLRKNRDELIEKQEERINELKQTNREQRDIISKQESFIKNVEEKLFTNNYNRVDIQLEMLKELFRDCQSEK